MNVSSRRPVAGSVSVDDWPPGATRPFRPGPADGEHAKHTYEAGPDFTSMNSPLSDDTDGLKVGVGP